MISYRLVNDQVVASRLRERFVSEIVFLEKVGFTPFSLHRELVAPFSVFIFFPIYLAMLMGQEVLQIQSPLRIASFHPIYVARDLGTYAYIYGMGCKFYTNFTDGTWLVSNTQLSLRKPSVIVVKSDPNLTSISKIWDKHREKISELVSREKQINPHLSFEAWADLDRQFDRSSRISVLSMGFIWLMLVASVLYWLISRLVTPAS